MPQLAFTDFVTRWILDSSRAKGAGAACGWAAAAVASRIAGVRIRIMIPQYSAAMRPRRKANPNRRRSFANTIEETIHMRGFRSVFHASRWWRAAVAVIVAAGAGASQESPKPARVAKRAPAAKAGTVDYQRDVHAIFAAHCLACHNADKRS